MGDLTSGSNASIIRHLLSQIRIGMDLSRITLPTFILEKRSTLEMYADFLRDVDLFVMYVSSLLLAGSLLFLLRVLRVLFLDLQISTLSDTNSYN